MGKNFGLKQLLRKIKTLFIIFNLFLVTNLFPFFFNFSVTKQVLAIEIIRGSAKIEYSKYDSNTNSQNNSRVQVKKIMFAKNDEFKNDGDGDGGEEEIDSDNNNQTKSAKQVIRDSATDAINSIIDETFRAISENVSQSIRKSINSNSEQNVKPSTSEGEDQEEYKSKTFTKTPEYKSEQIQSTEIPRDESRRQKPQRW